MKRLMFILVAGLVMLSAGCAQMLMDNMTNNMIKMMEAQAKIDKEKRAESYTIEGRFKSIEMKTAVVADNDPSKVEKKQEGNTYSVKAPTKTIPACVVRFEDGREKEFQSVSTKPMDVGKYYIIVYNGMNEIVSVTEATGK